MQSIFQEFEMPSKSSQLFRRKNRHLLFFLILSLTTSTQHISSHAFTQNPVKESLRTRRSSRLSKNVFAALPTKEETKAKSPIISQETKSDNARLSNIEIASEESSIPFFNIPESTLKPLALLLFSQFILFIGVGAVIPTIPIYGKEIGLSSAANGLVISAPAVALLLLAKPAGIYADKARKPAMMLGMAIIAISDLGTAMANSIIPLLIARLGLGAGRCISESGERGMLADLADTIPQLRGRALSIQQVLVALGIAIGAPAGGYIVEQYGPRASFLCVTGAATLSLLLYLFLPETLTKSDQMDSDLKDMTEEADANTPNIKWWELLDDPKWKGLTVLEIGARFGYAAKLASIPLIATSVLPGGAVGAGALISAAGLSGLIGGPVGGYLTDEIGSKNTVLLTGITSAVGLILIPFALQLSEVESIPDGAAFTAAVLMWSTSVAAQSPASNAFAQEISPPGSTATAMALPRAAGDSVYIIAPFLLGFITDLAGVPKGAECAFAGLCGLTGTILGGLSIRSNK